MAEPEGSAGRAIVIHDDESDPGSSRADSPHGSFAVDVLRSSICPLRTSEYHDQECSRYFDCPSHHLERAHPETDHPETEESAESHDQGHGEDHRAQNSPPTGELSSDGGGAQRPVEDLDTLAGESGRDSEEDVRHDSESDIYNMSQDGAEQSPGEAVDEEEAVGENTEGSPEADEAGSVRRQSLSLDTAAPRDMADITLPTPDPVAQPSQRSVDLPDRLSRELPRSPPPPTPPPLSPTYRRSRGDVNNPIPTEQLAREPRRPSSVSLPRWQPDAEVTFCPICHTQFSIFVRKHHCRKCGRVVCNSCSPHRITIPYQYIVQPPGAVRPLSQIYSTAFMGSEGGYADFRTLGGGERVRLCNPCVPDPNTTPHQAQESATQRGHSRSQSNASGVFPGDESRRYGAYFGPGPGGSDALSRSRSVSMHSAAGASSSRTPNMPYLSTQSRILAGTPPAYMPYPSSASGSQGPNPMYARYRSLLDVGSSSSSSTPALQQRSLPPPPQIPEEDECPVCHRELPSRTLPNFEALREAHINICITSHSAYGTTPTAAANTGQRDASNSPPPPPRRTGMFPYLATEKDCVDSAECTICLEEFEVGVQMARLECLCRFHRACIRAWFVNHPGRCPVHQHDSFGY